MRRRLRGGLATEDCRPPFWGELADESLGMGGDAEEHVFQILERRDVDQFATLHEGIEKSGATGAFEAARKEPVLATDRDAAQLVLAQRMPPAGLCRVCRQGRRPRRETECVSLGQAA